MWHKIKEKSICRVFAEGTRKNGLEDIIVVGNTILKLGVEK
jgi:hypothetical protein